MRGLSVPFYKSEKFKLLEQEWREKLSTSGFTDIEDEKERLRSYDRRTIAFENRDLILDFFTRLDHFLTHTPHLSARERTVLTLYSQGCYLKDIAFEIDQSISTVKIILRKYKKRI